MSKTTQQTEKMITNCIECTYLKEGMQKFPCEHLICKECLCLLLIDQEFNHKTITSNIIFYCPECLRNLQSLEKTPKITLSYIDINNIFSNSENLPLKCIKHPDKELKYFCDDCKDELCEECLSLDKEHENSNIAIEEIKSEETEKLLNNQCLTLDKVKNKIEENRKKINSEFVKSNEIMKQNINKIIEQLNNFINEYGEKSKEKEKIMNDYFDMMIKTYEKYYSMINSLALSFKTIKNISNMNNILDINLFPNDILPENLNSFNSLISDKLNEIKNIFPIKIEINFREGLIQTGNCSTFTTEHKEFMTGGILVNNGNNLVTSATDKSLIIYQPKLVDDEINYIVIKKEIENKIIATTLLNLVKEYFVVGYDDGLIKVWRTEDFEVDKIFTGHTAQINKIIKETDNSFISCSDDMTIRGWTLDTLEADSTFILSGHEDRINDILLIINNTVLLSISDDMTMRAWSLEIKYCLNVIKTNRIQTCLGNLRYGKFMVGGEDGSITIFNIDNFEPSMTINAHNEPIEVLYESPFTGEILSGSQDNLVKIFNSNNGTCTKILEGHKNTILYIYLLKEKVVITTSVDKTLKIWYI